MFRSIGNRKKGFTLIELAIVLTIAGLLFAGLWRLLSGGNQQVRDQSAASEQQQLISAVKGFLSAPQGQTFLSNIAANTAVNLALPTNYATCAGAPAGFCSFLPAGFINTTPNSYGQTFNIQVLKDNTTNVPPTPPNTYSFMIVTSGGDAIPDTSGGRISAAIGNDGGFLYTGAVCTGAASPQTACGSYGTWSIANISAAGPAGYGFGAGLDVGGHVASRTYSTPSANAFPWLARPPMPNDNTYVWNTMETDLYMGLTSQQTAPGYGNIYLAPFGTATGGSTLFLQGGQLSGTGTSTINMAALASPINGMTSSINITANGIATPLMNLSNGPCVPTGVGAGGVLSGQAPANCNYAITADNISATQLIYANAFYAQNFNYYSASDIRFKTDIHPLEDALANVMKLKPVSYVMKASGQKSMGVIAQDLEKVYPQLVSPGSGMKFVSYNGLIAPLIGAVQELKEENDRLRQELQTQQKRQDELEKRIKLSEPDKHP